LKNDKKKKTTITQFLHVHHSHGVGPRGGKEMINTLISHNKLMDVVDNILLFFLFCFVFFLFGWKPVGGRNEIVVELLWEMSVGIISHWRGTHYIRTEIWMSCCTYHIATKMCIVIDGRVKNFKINK